MNDPAAMIHPTAIIHSGARLAQGVQVGPYAVIGEHVEIGEGTTIGAHAVIVGHTRIGRNNRIFHHATLGEAPQDKKYAGEPTRLEIGDENTIREFCTLNTGTVQDLGVTRMGNMNWIMAYVHSTDPGGGEPERAVPALRRIRPVRRAGQLRGKMPGLRPRLPGL